MPMRHNMSSQRRTVSFCPDIDEERSGGMDNLWRASKLKAGVQAHVSPLKLSRSTVQGMRWRGCGAASTTVRRISRGGKFAG